MLLDYQLPMLYVLYGFVASYVAWRRDPLDRPVALMIDVIAVLDWARLGIQSALPAKEFVPHIMLFWSIDLIYVAPFGMHLVVALRYRSGEWPLRLVGRLAVTTVVLLLITRILRTVHLRYYDFGWRAVDPWWIVIYGLPLLLVSAAMYQLVRLLQSQEVALAHLVLLASAGLSLLQFAEALVPGALRIDLYRLGVLTYLTVGVIFYAIRMLIIPRMVNPNAS